MTYNRLSLLTALEIHSPLSNHWCALTRVYNLHSVLASVDGINSPKRRGS